METLRGKYLEGKHIFLKTGMFGLLVTKHYKVMEYDLDAKKYTVIDWEVNGPIEYIEILDEKNITVYVESIPVESSEDEDEDDVDMKDSVPFMAEDVQNMLKKELRAHCVTYGLKRDTVPAMKEALIRFLKTGEKGAKSEQTQKAEETKNALEAFLKFANVVAITSTISNFNPKNKVHAKSFLEQYRKKHGKGPIRSRKINLNVMRSPRRVDAVLGASMCVVRRGRRDGLRRGRRDAVDAFARFF